MSHVKTAGEAISVLVQVAELAQARGILSLEDAVITKSAIDLLKSLSTQTVQNEELVTEGPN